MDRRVIRVSLALLAAIGCGEAHLVDDAGIDAAAGPSDAHAAMDARAADGSLVDARTPDANAIDARTSDAPLMDAPPDMDHFVCPDSDGDGAADISCGGTDCDDGDPSVGPSSDEVCNGIDDDCDAMTDEDGPALCAGPTPGSVRDCIDGSCELIDCTSWADCDGDEDNGCEVDLTSDPLHCGDCGTVCPGAAGCIASVCTPTTRSLWVSGWEGDEQVYSVTPTGSSLTLVCGAYTGVATSGAASFPSQGGWDAFMVEAEPRAAFVFGGAGDEFARDGAMYSGPYFLIFVGEFERSLTYQSTTIPSEGGRDGFMLAIDFFRALYFLHVVGGPGDDRVSQLVHTLYSTYVAGEFEDSVDFGGMTLTSRGEHDVFVAELDVDGDPVWVRVIGGVGDERVSALSSPFAPMGNLRVSGSFEDSVTLDSVTLTSAGGADAYWIELNPTDGSVLSAVSGGGPGADVGTTTSLGGEFEDTAMFGTESVVSTGGRDIVLLDGAGAARAFGASGNETLAFYGSPYIAGTFEGSLAHATRTVLSAGGVDGFVAELSDTDEAIWAMLVSGPGTDTIVDGARLGVGRDLHTRLYVTGRFEGSAHIQGMPVTSVGVGDVFMWTAEP